MKWLLLVPVLAFSQNPIVDGMMKASETARMVREAELREEQRRLLEQQRQQLKALEEQRTEAATTRTTRPCIEPAVTIRDVDSALALASVAIAVFATAQAAYEDSLLSPEQLRNSGGTRPFSVARACSDRHLTRFVQSSINHVRQTATMLQTLLAVLEENEATLLEDLLGLSRGGASLEKIAATLKQSQQGGQARWDLFMTVAQEAVFAIGQFERVGSEKFEVKLALSPDEAALLRIEILKHFSAQRLATPATLRPSPRKAAAMLYWLLKEGRIDVGHPQW